MKFNSVDEYVNSLNENEKKYIHEFINFIEDEFPIIKPRMCFAMPMWWLGEKMYNGYVAISCAKKHYSIHFHDDEYLSKLKKKLPNCTFGKKCISIKYGDEQSILVVKQTVKNYFKSILK